VITKTETNQLLHEELCR